MTINCGAVGSDRARVGHDQIQKEEKMNSWLMGTIGSFAFWVPSIMADYDLNLDFVLFCFFFFCLSVCFTRD